MSSYHPFLRGKQNELLALRELADRIAENSTICPILEVVRANGGTRKSLETFAKAGMPFVFITNPEHGDFAGRQQELCNSFVADGPLTKCSSYIPAMYVSRKTSMREVDRYVANYGHLFRAVIYRDEPEVEEVKNWCASDDRIYKHIILNGSVTSTFSDSIPRSRRVTIYDHFKKQIRNADYPDKELFTDLNTTTGNPSNADWGDYSIVGDNFSEQGGPAYAVAIHHISKSESNGALYVNHYLSDRQETTADTPGKIIEATVKLVDDFEHLYPSDTFACKEFREMATTGESHNLGFLKKTLCPSSSGNYAPTMTESPGDLPDFQTTIALIAGVSVRGAVLEAETNVYCLKDETYGITYKIVSRRKLTAADIRRAIAREFVRTDAWPDESGIVEIQL